MKEALLSKADLDRATVVRADVSVRVQSDQRRRDSSEVLIRDLE